MAVRPPTRLAIAKVRRAQRSRPRAETRHRMNTRVFDEGMSRNEVPVAAFAHWLGLPSTAQGLKEARDIARPFGITIKTKDNVATLSSKNWAASAEGIIRDRWQTSTGTSKLNKANTDFVERVRRAPEDRAGRTARSYLALLFDDIADQREHSYGRFARPGPFGPGPRRSGGEAMATSARLSPKASGGRPSPKSSPKARSKTIRYSSKAAIAQAERAMHALQEANPRLRDVVHRLYHVNGAGPFMLCDIALELFSYPAIPATAVMSMLDKILAIKKSGKVHLGSRPHPIAEIEYVAKLPSYGYLYDDGDVKIAFFYPALEAGKAKSRGPRNLYARWSMEWKPLEKIAVKGPVKYIGQGAFGESWWEHEEAEDQTWLDVWEAFCTSQRARMKAYGVTGLDHAFLEGINKRKHASGVTIVTFNTGS